MKTLRILVLILIAGFASAAWGQPPTCGLYTAWAEFHRHNMQRRNPCEKVLNVHNVGNLGLKWSYQTGSEVYSSPAVASGVVYFTSADNHVYALKASTGAFFGVTPPVTTWIPRPPWRMGWCMSPRDIDLYALNASTGAVLWSYPTGGTVDSSPTAVNGVVYVGSEGYTVYALNASTGAKLWSYTTGNLVRSSPPWRMGWSMSVRGTTTCTR